MPWFVGLLAALLAGLLGQPVLSAQNKTEQCNLGAIPQKRIVCVFQTEADKTFRIDDIDPCMCTHLLYAYVSVDYDDLSLMGIAEEEFKSLSELKKKNTHLKTMLSFQERQLSLIARNKTLTERFGKHIRNVYQTNDIDGIDVQWQFIDVLDPHNMTDEKTMLTTFTKKLRAALPDSVISITTTKNPHLLVKGYDFRNFSKHIDFVNIPAFQFGLKNVSTVKHPGRLHGVADMENVDSIVDLLLTVGLVKEKIVIGVPSFGVAYDLVDKEKTVPGSPAKVDNPNTFEPLVLSHPEVCAARKTGNWTLVREKDQTAPYAYRDNQWIGFDDEISLRLKSKYILLRNLGGAMIWSINNDDYRGICGNGKFPLSRSIRDVFTGVRSVVHNKTSDDLEEYLDYSESRVVELYDQVGNVLKVDAGDTVDGMTCTRQGYYRHPADCTHFYRCVKFDQLTDAFSIFQYDCPVGLVFDQRYEVCNWPSWSAPCDGSGEVLPVPRSDFFCPGLGFYSDPENCRWFFYCNDVFGNGTLSAYEFKCPHDLAFDQEHLFCDWKWLVPGCGVGGGASYAAGASVSQPGRGFRIKPLDGYQSGALYGQPLGGIPEATSLGLGVGGLGIIGGPVATGYPLAGVRNPQVQALYSIPRFGSRSQSVGILDGSLGPVGIGVQPVKQVNALYSTSRISDGIKSVNQGPVGVLAGGVGAVGLGVQPVKHVQALYSAPRISDRVTTIDQGPVGVLSGGGAVGIGVQPVKQVQALYSAPRISDGVKSINQGPLAEVKSIHHPKENLAIGNIATNGIVGGLGVQPVLLGQAFSSGKLNGRGASVLGPATISGAPVQKIGIKSIERPYISDAYTVSRQTDGIVIPPRSPALTLQHFIGPDTECTCKTKSLTINNHNHLPIQDPAIPIYEAKSVTPVSGPAVEIPPVRIQPLYVPVQPPTLQQVNIVAEPPLGYQSLSSISDGGPRRLPAPQVTALYGQSRGEPGPQVTALYGQSRGEPAPQVTALYGQSRGEPAPQVTALYGPARLRPELPLPPTGTILNQLPTPRRRPPSENPARIIFNQAHPGPKSAYQQLPPIPPRPAIVEERLRSLRIPAPQPVAPLPPQEPPARPFVQVSEYYGQPRTRPVVPIAPVVQHEVPVKSVNIPPPEPIIVPRPAPVIIQRPVPNVIIRPPAPIKIELPVVHVPPPQPVIVQRRPPVRVHIPTIKVIRPSAPVIIEPPVVRLPPQQPVVVKHIRPLPPPPPELIIVQRPAPVILQRPIPKVRIPPPAPIQIEPPVIQLPPPQPVVVQHIRPPPEPIIIERPAPVIVQRPIPKVRIPPPVPIPIEPVISIDIQPPVPVRTPPVSKTVLYSQPRHRRPQQTALYTTARDPRPPIIDLIVVPPAPVQFATRPARRRRPPSENPGRIIFNQAHPGPKSAHRQIPPIPDRPRQVLENVRGIPEPFPVVEPIQLQRLPPPPPRVQVTQLYSQPRRRKPAPISPPVQSIFPVVKIRQNPPIIPLPPKNAFIEPPIIDQPKVVLQPVVRVPPVVPIGIDFPPSPKIPVQPVVIQQKIKSIDRPPSVSVLYSEPRKRRPRPRPPVVDVVGDIKPPTPITGTALYSNAAPPRLRPLDLQRLPPIEYIEAIAPFPPPIAPQVIPPAPVRIRTEPVRRRRPPSENPARIIFNQPPPGPKSAHIQPPPIPDRPIFSRSREASPSAYQPVESRSVSIAPNQNLYGQARSRGRGSEDVILDNEEKVVVKYGQRLRPGTLNKRTGNIVPPGSLTVEPISQNSEAIPLSPTGKLLQKQSDGEKKSLVGRARVIQQIQKRVDKPEGAFEDELEEIIGVKNKRVRQSIQRRLDEQLEEFEEPAEKIVVNNVKLVRPVQRRQGVSLAAFGDGDGVVVKDGLGTNGILNAGGAIRPLPREPELRVISDDQPQERKVRTKLVVQGKSVIGAAKEGFLPKSITVNRVIIKEIVKAGNSLPHIACTRPGLFRHPDDCNKFYECYWDKWINKFTLHLFECPVKTAFDDNVFGCNLLASVTPCVKK